MPQHPRRSKYIAFHARSACSEDCVGPHLGQEAVVAIVERREELHKAERCQKALQEHKENSDNESIPGVMVCTP